MRFEKWARDYIRVFRFLGEVFNHKAITLVNLSKIKQKSG